MTNVALLSVDALSARHTSLLGYDRETTPNLSDLAEAGVAYRTCIAQSSHTRESVPSLLTSAYPFSLGEVGPLPPDQPTLSTTLSDAGYTTGAFHSNPYLSRAYGFNRGFDDFDDSLSLSNSRLTTFLHRVINHFKSRPYVSADDLTDSGLSWVEDNRSDDWFLWLHYMDPHGPYQPPEPYQKTFADRYVGPDEAKRLWRRTVDEPETITEAERATLIDLYDAEIRFTDEMVGRFVDELDRRNALEDTIVVVAADHGDSFGSHGHYGHPRFLYEELIHVPLVVAGPSLPSNVRVERPVENIDIAPTIIHRLGVEVPSEFDGSPLPTNDEPTDVDTGVSTAEAAEPPADETPVFAEAHSETDDTKRFAVRTNRYKYHVGVGPDDERRTEELYDLRADPYEETDLVESEPTLRNRLWETVREHAGTVTADRAEAATDTVTSEVEDRLKDLGYQ